MTVTRRTHPRPRISNLILGSGKPITMLVAPSGWGKTWAAAQTLEDWPGESLWITGHADHADPTCFTNELWQQLTLQGCLAPNHGDSRSLENLSAQLDPDTRLLLIVDEAERIHTDAILGLMRAALSGQAPITLLIALRRARYPHGAYPGIPEASINVLTSNDLAFTRDEIIALGGEDTPALTRYDSHGGWPVAVATLNQQGDDEGGLTGLIQRALDKLPDPVRELVTLLSTSTVWSEALAERVTGIPPAEWQATVIESGLPVHRGGLGELRPHNLVRDTLLKALKNNPTQHRHSLLATADHAELRGDTRHALDLLHEAQAWHQLARVLRDYTSALASNQRWQEIVDVTDALPLQGLPAAKQAYLKHVAGIALVNVSRDLKALYAAGYASQVDVEPGSKADPTYLAAKGHQLMKRALQLDPDSQIAHVSRLKKAMFVDDVLTAREVAREGWELGPLDPVWHLYLGFMLVALESLIGGFQAAGAAARQIRLAMRYGHGDTATSLTVRALEYHFRGLTDTSEIERVRSHLKTSAAEPFNEADRLYLAAVSEAMLAQERAHELLADLEEYRSRAPRPHPRTLQFIYRYRGVALMMDGRIEDGAQSLKRAYQLAKHDPIVRSRSTAMYQLALLRCGRIDEAAQLLLEMPEPRASTEVIDQTVQRAALAIAQGQHERASALLAEVDPVAAGFTSFGCALHASLDVANRIAAGGDPVSAVTALERTLANDPTASQRFWWMGEKKALQSHLMTHHPDATRTIMALTRALLGATPPPKQNVQNQTP